MDDWRELNLANLTRQRLKEFRTAAAGILEQEYGDAQFFVLKEPRISRFVTFYTDLLNSLGIDTKIVISTRSPASVAASLEARDGATDGFATLIWLRHALSSEFLTRGSERVFVSYEKLIEDWSSAIVPIVQNFGNCGWKNVDKAEPDIDAFLALSLQHHKADLDQLDIDPGLADWAQKAYHALSSLEDKPEDNEALTTLDRIRSELDETSQRVGSAFVGELSARYMEIAGVRLELEKSIALRDSRISKIQNELSDLSKDLADARDLTSRLESELARSTIEIDRSKRELAETQKQARDAHKAVVLEAGRAKRVFRDTQREFQLIRRQLEEKLSVKEMSVAHLKYQKSELDAELVRIRNTENDLREVVYEMQRSTSWRITHPMRVIVSALRPAKRTK